jgi:predicted permease
VTPVIYRLLIRLCPREFRHRFGDELMATAAEASGRGWGSRTRAFGDALVTVIGLRRDLRRERGGRRSGGSWWRDFAMAGRTLWREPRFTTVIVATLGVAIAAVATMFSLMDRLLLTGPAALGNSGQLRRVELVAQVPGRGEVRRSVMGHVLFAAVRDHAAAITGAASYTRSEGTLGYGAAARSLWIGYASSEFFTLLESTPERGRYFVDSDPATRDDAPVVVSHGFARVEFGDDDPVGRRVLVNGVERTVIGVTPRGFTGADVQPVDVWLPIRIANEATTNQWQTTWNAQWLQTIVRVPPEASDALLADDLTRVFRAVYDGSSSTLRDAEVQGVPLTAARDTAEGSQRQVLWWLSAVAALILLVACANTMSLMLVRGTLRRRELGVRLALGAPRRALIRMFVAEAAVLSLLSTAAGLALAMVLSDGARTVLFADVAWTVPLIDLRLMAALTTVAATTTLLTGLVPALAVTRPGTLTSLRTVFGDATAGRGRGRRALIVVQTAASVVLLVGAGLFLRSFWNARTLDLGVDADQVLVLELARSPLGSIPEAQRPAERARRRTVLIEAASSVAGISGVDGAAVAVGMPFGYAFGLPVSVPALADAAVDSQSISAVSPGYFDVVGTRMIEGRAFDGSDRADSAPVAIVSSLFARRMWSDRTALGECLSIAGGPCATVVGVAADTYRERLREDPVPHVYIPLGQESGFGGDVLLARSTRDLDAVAAEAAGRIAALDSSVSRIRSESLRARVDPQLHSWRLGSTVFVFAGLLALMMAAAGVYSALSFTVTSHRHEIGVKLALGASTSHIGRVVIRSGLTMVVIGLMAGLVATSLLSGRLEPLLFDVSAQDPLVYGVVVGTLLLVAVIASVAPAVRARSVDPLVVLKGES